MDTRGYFEHTFIYLKRFMDLSRSDFDLIIPLLELRTYDKKTYVVEQGEVDNYLNIVLKGLVRKYVKAPKGEVTLQLATEGHLVQSEISFHKRIPSDIILETIENSILVSVHHDNIEYALKQLPGAEALGRSIVTQMFIKKDNRYMEQLNISTRERFLQYMNNHPHMLQRVPQKILASYLNIKPETFSRLKHLVKKQ
jgi:CRP-like cAMP-binding protein